MVIGNLYSNGSVAATSAGDGGGAAAAVASDVNDIDGAQVLDVNAKSPSTPPGNDGGHAQFGEAKNGDDIGQQERHIKGTGSSSSRSSNDISVTSHESEMPLALSMTS